MKRFSAFVRRYKYSSAIAGIAAIVLIIGLVFYSFGYRLAPGFTVLRAGTLHLTGLTADSLIYIDDAFAARGVTDYTTLLIPGGHRIIVSAPGKQPWNELASIEASAETTLRPIYVDKTVSTRRLDGAEKTEAEKAIYSYALPTKAKPLSMAGGCALVYDDANRIVAEASTSPSCTPPAYLCPQGTCNPTLIFTPHEPLTGIMGFPGRDDVLIIATNANAYVLELDPRQPEFFAPLVSGPTLRIAPWSDHSVVAKAGISYYEISL